MNFIQMLGGITTLHVLMLRSCLKSADDAWPSLGHTVVYANNQVLRNICTVIHSSSSHVMKLQTLSVVLPAYKLQDFIINCYRGINFPKNYKLKIRLNFWILLEKRLSWTPCYGIISYKVNWLFQTTIHTNWKILIHVDK